MRGKLRCIYCILGLSVTDLSELSRGNEVELADTRAREEPEMKLRANEVNNLC